MAYNVDYPRWNGFFFDFFVGISFIRRQTSDVFERPTLRGCQCLCVLGRVKPLRTLTLPCQRTNPDGVICGRAVVEMGWWMCRVLCKNYHLTIHFWGLSAKCWNVEAWGGFLWPNFRWNRGFFDFFFVFTFIFEGYFGWKIQLREIFERFREKFRENSYTFSVNKSK